MWPWEHLAVGYLLYSLSVRARSGGRPGHGDAVVLLVATQLPDLIDKPLAWSLGVLPSGVSLGHSLLFALPLCLVVAVLTRRSGRPSLGWAFAVGYLSHPFADVLYTLLTDGTVVAGFLLWPLVPAPTVAGPGLLARVHRFLDQWVAFLGTPRGKVYLLLEVCLLAGATALWVADRYPGVGWLRRGVDGVAGLGRRP